ncbi:membrane-bound alkaline phosphatase-like [Pectinophora gossypiella]|uniref:membrane-bound alkaline phosphatase-like n=1 Tax=Pectinophora gossypiella TaxID=13191 RepID=UPI00214EB94A|nr:membrane-bound alkaline phosphatase-like [Pectinophora gossypiella]
MSRAALLAGLLALATLAQGHDEYHRQGAPRARAEAGERLADPAELRPEHWAQDAAAATLRRLAAGAARGAGVARNVVLFLGDGMSGATMAAARAHLGQRSNRTGEETDLYFETFPTVGLAKTYCVDAQIADSACTGTAYLCGVKANRGTLGVSAAVARGHCRAAVGSDHHVDSIAAWALQDGRDAGIVTTTRVTHASPAAAYAHSAERDWESDTDVADACADTPAEHRQDDIAKQLVHSFPGNQFRVILGGGRREFLPNTTLDEDGTPGRRSDGRDLIAEWRTAQAARGRRAQYVSDLAQLRAAADAAAPPDALLGLFAASHLPYHLQAAPGDPSLADLTEAAIRVLARNPRGFFLFVEGGRIDHAHHDNLPRLALDETVELAAAVERAAALLDERDSLLLVTSDHAHVMTYNGYARRGGDVLGPSDEVDARGVPYMTLSYANGPGFRPHVAEGLRDDLTRYDYTAAEFPFEAGAPRSSETHGGDDVAVFARGPAHALLAGLQQQSHVPRRAAAAACLGPPPHAPACRRWRRGAASSADP